MPAFQNLSLQSDTEDILKFDIQPFLNNFAHELPQPVNRRPCVQKTSKVIDCFKNLFFRHINAGKDIYKNSSLHREHLLVLPTKICASSKNPGIAPTVARVSLICLQKIFILVQFLSADLTEFIEIIPQHFCIDVIIPWNKSLVPHCPKQGSTIQNVPDVVLSTDTINLYQHIQLNELHPADIFRRIFKSFHAILQLLYTLISFYLKRICAYKKATLKPHDSRVAHYNPILLRPCNHEVRPKLLLNFQSSQPGCAQSKTKSKSIRIITSYTISANPPKT